MSNEGNILPAIENPKDFSQNVLQTLVKCLKSSATIPSSGSDYAYYCSFKGFQLLMQKEKKSVLEIMKSLIPGQNIQKLFDVNDVEDKFDILLDVNASMYENIGSQLDEATCPRKKPEELVMATKTMLPINTSWNKTTKELKTTNSTYSLLSSKNIQRPQVSFKEKVDNSNSPFVPKIKEKPHSLKPLSILIETNEYGEEIFSHPYEFELEKFHPLEKQLQTSEPIVPKALDETPLIMVDTEEELNKMIEDLTKWSSVAIDIENHSYRSFQGFSCLIQISTREKDYIIDAIKLRSELQILNEITANPKIVKVLHGADMDVMWLQRDFGIYIVNLFDTGQAARTLNFAHLSLAYLMKHYCNLDVDKQFQLADWRIRPLPDPLIKYAREDTHYLLYIYDCIKNDLLNRQKTKSLLLLTLEKCKDLCLKRYQKLLFDDRKYLDVCKKSGKILDERQLFCLKEMYAWRDGLAREQDESYGYILPNHMLLKIAEVMPKDQPGIIACCNPVPPIVVQQVNEISRIVMKARNCPVNKNKSFAEEMREIQRPTVINSSLNSLHDFHHNADEKIIKFQQPVSDRPFNIHDILKSTVVPVKKKLDLPLDARMKWKNKKVSSEAAQKVAKAIDEENKTPFERYHLTLEFYKANRPKEESEAAPAPSKESLNKSFIEIMNSSLDSSQSCTPEISRNSTLNISSDQTGTGNDTTVDMENEADDSESQTPIRKKNKRKKAGRGVADIPLESPKKVKVDTPPIKPFNYGEAAIEKLISNAKKSSKSFNPNETTGKQKFSKKLKKRKQKGKIFTGQASERKTNWPKS